LTALFLSPVLGIVIDKIKLRGIITAFGTGAMMQSFICLAVLSVSPLYAIAVIGFTFALVPSAMWPCVPVLVEEKQTGTAFGLLSAFINSGLTGVYYLQAFIAEKYDFESQILFYALLALVGLILATVFNVLDYMRRPPLKRCNE